MIEPNRQKSGLVLVAAAVGLAVIAGVGAYFGAEKLNLPLKIKEKVTAVQPVFDDYTRVLKNIIEHLKEDSSSGSSDADAIRRDVARAEGYLKEADSLEKNLTNGIDGLSLTELKDYKKKVEEYKVKAKAVVEVEKQMMEWATDVVEPIGEYQKSAVSLSGVSNYMYSDPDRYTKEIDAFIVKDTTLIDKVNQARATGSVREMNDLLVKKMKNELDFLKRMSESVKNRDVRSIAEAEKAYAEGSQAANKEMGRVGDLIKAKNRELAAETESLEARAREEYNRLKSFYRF